MRSNIENALLNILWFIAKQDDAPCSAQIHLDTALYLLIEACPNFKTENQELVEIINDANEHIRALLGKK